MRAIPQTWNVNNHLFSKTVTSNIMKTGALTLVLNAGLAHQWASFFPL